MPITEIRAGDKPEQSYFHISDLIEAYDRPMAHAINHIYNHLKVLLTFAFSNVSVEPVNFLIKNHPALRPAAQRMAQNASQTDSFDKELHFALQEEIVRTLQAELIELIVQTVQLAKVVDMNKPLDSEKIEPDIRRLETLIASIPFVDYHNRNEEPPSRIHVEE